MKSRVPRKAATATEMPITIRVYLRVSFFVGQFTFFNSKKDSLKKVVIFLEIFLKFISL
jgi:cell division FtsZ-interacting protein ZapD